MNTNLVLAGLLAMALFASVQLAAQEVSSNDAGRNAKRLFAACRACHSLEVDGAQTNGPKLYALWGRKAGSNEGFDYSEAMKKSSIIWSEQTLDAFLKNPQAAIPGNQMGYAGMSDDAQRKLLIEYLKQQIHAP